MVLTILYQYLVLLVFEMDYASYGSIVLNLSVPKRIATLRYMLLTCKQMLKYSRAFKLRLIVVELEMRLLLW